MLFQKNIVKKYLAALPKEQTDHAWNTLNPSPDYNLITEKKNETNSKKADGAILF